MMALPPRRVLWHARPLPVATRRPEVDGVADAHDVLRRVTEGDLALREDGVGSGAA
jgi:hypothetical protein